MPKPNRPTTWVELCCGSAAVTLRLLGGSRAVPPCTYQGGKRKFGRAILNAFGLRAGQGADRVVLCDAGPWGDVWSHLTAGVDLRPYMAEWNALDDAGQAEHFKTLRSRLPELAGPERAAAWLWLLQRSFGGKGPQAGRAPRKITMGPRSKQGEWRHTIDAPVPALGRLSAMPWPSTTVHHGDIRDVDPISGSVVYVDPNYQGTTRYQHGIPRGALLELALRHDRAGAVVAISEAVPLPIPGWHHVEITSQRTSTPRNRSKQQREWLTMNRPPAVVPPVQFGLF